MRRTTTQLNWRQRLHIARAREHADFLQSAARRADDGVDHAIALLRARMASALAAHDRAADHLAILDGTSAGRARARVRVQLRRRVAEHIEGALSAPRRGSSR